MNERKGKRVAAVAAGALGVVVIVALTLIYRESIPGAPDRSREPLPRPLSYNGRVDIAQGSIAVSEFADFLESFTGLNVIADSDVSNRQVLVASNVENADAEVARALIESSGCVVEREKLPNGVEILRIRAAPQ